MRSATFARGTLAALVLWGCRDTTGPTPVAPRPAALVVAESLTVLEGDSARLNALLTDSLGDTLRGYPVVWAVADTTIATVSSAGLVRFRHPGYTVVVALAGGFAGHTAVTAAVRYVGVSLGSVYGYFATVCGVTARGSLLCLQGQVGNTLTAVPIPVGGMTRLVQGTSHGCGVATDSLTYCWGNNAYGQLGGDTALGLTYGVVDTPVLVAGGIRFRSLTAGVQHTCGLTPSGAAYCWGGNADRQLGDGDSTVAFTTMPAAVAGGLTFDSIAAGDFHTCGLTGGGQIYCWGSNASMALGTGDSTILSSSVPRQIVSAAHFVQVVAGNASACGLADDGTAYCWGNNDFKQLGVDSTTGCAGTGGYACSDLPQKVSGGLSFRALAAHAGLGNGADGLTCGVTTGGAAYCWGRNIVGEVGDGTTTTRATPVPVTSGLTFASIAVGDFQSCGSTTGGIVYCWGFNFGTSPVRFPVQ